MKNFKTINNATGWVVFAIATIVYVMTMEQTASFWDCGEFIAVSYKLMVPHPPGAPFFLLMGRMFSFLAFGDVEQVSYWITMLSVISSGFTILFLFWTIVLLGRKFVKPSQTGEYDLGQTAALMVAGVIGALAYTFSDSFWFSAVEAEVYGMSSFFTAFVLWAMLKWELIEDEGASNRWLLMIVYMMGLSIGVHLLNLVTVPALALIYYFKKYPNPTRNGVIAALAAGGGIILIIMYGVIPGLPSLAGAFEVTFVNSFGAPFGTGLAFFLILLIGGLVYGIIYSEKKQNLVLNNALLGLTFILIGYASYGLVVVRSNFDPPIDENDPENIVSFVSYLKREQYGNRPLVFGQTFMSERSGVKTGSPVYRKTEDKYEIVDYKQEPEYADRMLLPRVYSQQGGHDQLYRQWIGLREGEKPTFGDNIYYMFRYQFGHMYFRYFMWNFSGRESDEKDAGWLTISDVGEELPESLARNKARNNFFMLPLILGLVGAFFHFKKDRNNFWVTLLLFFLTGLALVLYLNSPPVEPRERDYIYVGSFYAFAIWIGFGALAVAEGLGNVMKGNKLVASAIAGVLCFSVPAIMAAEGWDNHNRANRWHSVDQAKNTLASCAPNAILFTGGDNDTFPLWYVQEVEGFRTDVRVIVLSYFSTDWYIEQMRRPAYESEPIPMTMQPENYIQSTNDFVPLVEETEGAMNIKSYIRLVDKKDPRVLVPLQGGDVTAKLPTRTLMLDIDKEKVKELGFIPKGKEGRVVDKMVWQLKPQNGHIFKNELALLDLLATNDWERPIYFNNTSANTMNLDLRQYMHMEGMTYRLMPIRANNTGGDVGEVNTEVMMENLNKFAFRGFDDPNTYNDDEYRKFGSNTRNAFFRLAQKLYDEDREEQSKAILDLGLKNIPDTTIPYSFFVNRYAELYHELGAHDEAKAITEVMGRRAVENLDYLIQKEKRGDNLVQMSMLTLQQLMVMYRRLEDAESSKISRLENELLITEEGGSEAELEKAKEMQTYFSEQALKYTEQFSNFSQLVQ